MMSTFRRLFGICAVIFVVQQSDSAPQTDSTEWSFRSLSRQSDDFSNGYANNSTLVNDISLFPADKEIKLAPSGYRYHYEPNKRICEDMFPPTDETTMADTRSNFVYEVYVDWYSVWHLNIGVRPLEKFTLKGLIVQVRHNGIPVGKYYEAPDFSNIDCPPGKQNTAYFSSIYTRYFRHVAWMPPPDFDPKALYVVHTTVIAAVGVIYRKTTKVSLWESLPPGYFITDPDLNSLNVEGVMPLWNMTKVKETVKREGFVGIKIKE